ncbi:hypothetical protein SS50377_25957 [Spironucleus salmonicida]|uniref:Uncharacterized protein n=1 Tax=Spironucleus salmonicida TaxID=348837 RepID=V6LR87_9EUKA|nr:hypothetical protein SS50377_25957 [Spironucleus salmonicida]|eukprot:EST46763.1 Hypothetical protein SS50377_13225 [Spironucleus salmonicida]
MRRKKYFAPKQAPSKYITPPPDNSPASVKAIFWKKRALYARAACELSSTLSLQQHKLSDFNEEHIAKFYNEEMLTEIKLLRIPLQEKLRNSIFEIKLLHKKADTINEYYSCILTRKIIVILMIIKRCRGQFCYYE